MAEKERHGGLIPKCPDNLLRLRLAVLLYGIFLLIKTFSQEGKARRMRSPEVNKNVTRLEKLKLPELLF